MWRVNLSPFPLHFLILSPFLTARLPGYHKLCSSVARFPCGEFPSFPFNFFVTHGGSQLTFKMFRLDKYRAKKLPSLFVTKGGPN